MHEFSVCQALLEQVSGIAAQHRAEGVRRITVRIGPLSGVEPALLEQAFPLAAAGTAAADARLEIESLPVRVRCRDCGAETEAAVNRLLCGACQSYRTQLLSGEELVLSSIELLGARNEEEDAGTHSVASSS